MSCIQFIVIAIISTFAMIFKENITFAGIKAALVPILYAGVLSSGIAYYSSDGWTEIRTAFGGIYCHEP